MAAQLEYTIITNSNQPTFISTVNLNIANGWSIHGNLSVCVNPVNGAITFYQAMTR